MGCEELEFQIIKHPNQIRFCCPTCKKVFAGGTFTIELGCCGNSKIVCDPERRLAECCQSTFPIPAVFDTQENANNFIEFAKAGRYSSITLAEHKYFTTS